MLVLSRKAGERIQIGDNITVIVQRLSGNRVALGIEAPDDVKIIRGELERLVTQFDDPRPAAAAQRPQAPESLSQPMMGPTQKLGRRGENRLHPLKAFHRASA